MGLSSCDSGAIVEEGNVEAFKINANFERQSLEDRYNSCSELTEDRQKTSTHYNIWVRICSQ